MTAEAFVADLLEEMDRLFAQLGEEEALEAESEGKVEVETLLELALKSELEASELAGAWMPSTPELDAKQLLALQCGDEMRHFRIIGERLRALGRDPEAAPPLAEGYSPLYRYLLGLRTTVERVAGGPFAREAIAKVRNQQFIAFCDTQGDRETAELYRRVIQPDEVRHHELGRRVLERYCTTDELQARAAAAVRSTLAIADELRTLTARRTGAHHIPVS